MTKTRDLANLGSGFTQAGTGAVQRPVQSKLQDVVSVKDFGAAGDGGTDDTNAFAAAFAVLNTGSNPKGLFIPAGNYLVAPGTCSITTSNRCVYGEGPASKIIIPTLSAGGTGIIATGTSDSVHISDVHITDLSVVASGWTSGNGTNGITINKGDRCSVQRCTVLGDPSGLSWEQGIIFRDVNDCLISNNIVRRMNGNGISLDVIIGSESTSGNLVTGNTVSIIGDAGIAFHNNVRYSAAVGNVVDRPAQNSGTGLDLAGCNYCLFTGNTISNSGQYGIRVAQNLSYRTVDNVVSNNIVYHPSTAGSYAALTINDAERNTIVNNTLIGNTSSFADRGIYVSYLSTGTQTHPITGESLYKLRDSVIKNNTIRRFDAGVLLDAGGGITGATLTLDGNVFSDCTTGLSFTTASNEVRFTLFGHNAYQDCTTNVSSTTGGIARNGDYLRDTLDSSSVYTNTTGAETMVAKILVDKIPSQNTELYGIHRVSEFGAYDGRIRYKDSAGTTLVSDIFGEVTNVIRSSKIPLAAKDLLTVSIEKTGSPATGSVTCDGLTFEHRTFY